MPRDSRHNAAGLPVVRSPAPLPDNEFIAYLNGVLATGYIEAEPIPASESQIQRIFIVREDSDEDE
jgi:hypothetical protein